ncbi:universal stress protein [Amycolatopsis anabasis]|uniref:universal stress protein n=1 Tax=Amycolatopsis anabasis TaxID=1840409 RepID=UPI00131DF045|nr:universal stress protein [Amycolatopsis anabasis]
MSDLATRRVVLAGVDGSPSAIHAVRWAAREAARRQAPLRLFHACPLPPATAHVPVALRHDYRDTLLVRGHEWLAEAEFAATQVAPGITVRRDLRVGAAAGQLVRESASAGLVVVGSRGLGGFGGLALGSVADALAQHGHCPVVVVRGRAVGSAPPDTGPVVVGVDGSPISDAAVEFAFDAAAARAVPLVAVHTWSDVILGEAWVRRDSQDTAEAEASLLSERLATWRDKHPEVEVIERVIQDRPVRGLLKEAEGAQLIVVGSRGRGGFTGMGLGSTSQALLHHSTCPVAVIRPEPAR